MYGFSFNYNNIHLQSIPYGRIVLFPGGYWAYAPVGLSSYGKDKVWYNNSVLAEEAGVNPALPRNGDVRPRRTKPGLPPEQSQPARDGTPFTRKPPSVMARLLSREEK